MALTDVAVRQARTIGKDYTLPYFDGLSLAESASGGKSWHFRYYWAAKQKRMSLGTYPEVSLREARAQRDEARAQLAKGVNPKIDRKQKLWAVRLATENSFKAVYLQWLAHRRLELKEGRQSTLAQIQRVFDRDVLPALGAMSGREAGDVLGFYAIRFAEGQVALDAGLPVLDGAEVVVLVEVQQVALGDVQGDDLIAVIGQGDGGVAGASRFEDHAAFPGDPVMLDVFPGALDGVDDHRAGVMMLRHRGTCRHLEQGDGFAAHWVAFDVLEQYVIAVGAEGNPGQILIVDRCGIDIFVVHGSLLVVR